MNSFESQRPDSLKRRWHQQQQQQDRRLPNINTTSTTRFVGAIATSAAASSHHSSSAVPFLSSNPNNINNSTSRPQSFSGLNVDGDLVSTVVPPVTVVLEGRSICQRICLHKHDSYQSLAKALRQMFVEGNDDGVSSTANDLDLSNAIPGHLIAYEDMENDLLLAGDLNWKDFVRVAKRIRILPAKGNSKKERGGGA